ncbi:MAG: hypothetical protein V4665_03360 [Patescibacteria group bacterium]
MIGKFIEGDKPMIEATIAWGQAVQTPYFVLDTGFTGDLAVTPEIAVELGLNIDGVTKMRTASNELIAVRSAVALASMEGENIYITVLITDGLPLLGIAFMEKFKYKAIVDCKNKTVALEVSK